MVARQHAPITPKLSKVLIAAIVGATLLFPLSFPPSYYIYILALIFLWGMVATSWSIVGGYAGYTSLGHAVFLGVGGYISAFLVLHYGVSPFLSAPLAGLACFVLGIGAGLVSLRTRAEAFVIVTLTMGLVVQLIALNVSITGGASGLPLPLYPWSTVFILHPFYYAFFALLLVTVYASYRVRHSKFGLGLMAIREDEERAETFGVNTFYHKIIAFAISAFFVGVGGAIFSYFLTYIDPSIFGIGVSVEIVLMALLGGKNSVLGPLLGAAILIPASEFFTTFLGSSELNQVMYGALLLLVAMYLPNGLTALFRKSMGF